jgi:hypothetical protein
VRRLRPLPIGGLLLLAACAPSLTPQQEWVMTKFEECRTRTGGWNARPDRVEPDGRYHVTVAQTRSDFNRVKACIDEEMQRDPPKVAPPPTR